MILFLADAKKELDELFDFNIPTKPQSSKALPSCGQASTLLNKVACWGYPQSP